MLPSRKARVGLIRRRDKHHVTSREVFRRARTLRAPSGPRGRTSVGPSLKMIASYQLGLCLLRLGHRRRAIVYLERSRDIRLKQRPEGNTTELDGLILEAQGD